jgi:hypothetical protein
MLREGTKFEIPSLQDNMRNMRLISVSDCSSLIEGQKRDLSDEPWKPFRYHVSNSVMVQVANSSDFEPADISQTKVEAATERPKRGRGRPSKDKAVFKNLQGIQEESFTVKNIIAKNNLKEYEAHLLIKQAVLNGDITQVAVKTGGRGKPQKVYKLN